MASEKRVGDVLASKYRLEELLGSGGMGHVYRAVNLDVGRAVAIKVLRSEYAEDASLVERFLREARAANLVRHPNVVDVIDIGREVGGPPFIVQELLEGEDLAHLVARRGGALPVDEVVDILGPVIDAVAEAHARGVIHRDLKPENVFLARGKRAPIPKLLDFGISKVRSADLQATEAGVLMGTPAYMAPEQLKGASDADPRSDVWALGVMLFEILAGRMPFEQTDAPSLFFAIATKDAPTLLEIGLAVPPEISRVVARCLRRNPVDRYPSAAELARDLRHVLEGSELEPTGRRSVPPSVRRSSGSVQAGAIPRAPRPPKLVTGTEPPAAPTFRDAFGSAPLAAPPEAENLPKVRQLMRPGIGTLPSAVPAPRLPPRQPGDLGQMHAVARAPVSPPTRAHAPPVAKPAADTSTLVGVAVVLLVVILGVGLLMQLVHRPEGWPVSRLVVQGQLVEAAINGVLGLAGLGVGGIYGWRGVRHWRGELGGGPPNAIVNAVIAALALFCVIELVCAVT